MSGWRAADATAVQAVDDHLDAIEAALGTVERWNDDAGARHERQRDQLATVETRLEPSLRGDGRQRRAIRRPYGRRFDRRPGSAAGSAAARHNL